MKPTEPTPSPQEPEETTAEMLADVLNLVEETTSRITDEDVEARLRRLLQRKESSDEGDDPQETSPPLSLVREASGSREPEHWMPSGVTGLDQVAFERHRRGLSLLVLVAQRLAGDIVAAAHREAEEQQDAALTQATQTLRVAREEAERILRHARKEAAQLASSDAGTERGAPGGKAWPLLHRRKRTRRPRAYATVIVIVITTVTTGVLAAGIAAGAVVVTVPAALALAAIPITMFAHNQIELTDRMREVSTAVAKSPNASEKSLEVLGADRADSPNFRDFRDGRTRFYADSFSGDQRRNDPRPWSFWSSLTRPERDAFSALAQQSTFPPGKVLYHEGEPGDHLLVLQSGWVQISVDRGGGERVLALRGPGDLIGERTVLRLRSRSATVTSLTTVSSLLASVEAFAAFLEDHPRVVAVLEQQVFDRLREGAGRPLPNESGTASPASWVGQNCAILLTDIAGFKASGRHSQDRRTARRMMYELLRDALEKSGVPREVCHWEDRGDGALIIIPPTVPTSSAVDPLIGRLSTTLRRHNRQANESTRLQLRVALHVGQVTSGSQGLSGKAVDQTDRLLKAPILKEQLDETGAYLGFIASSFVYDVVIRHNSGYVDPDEYRRVEVPSKKSTITAWINLIGTTTTIPTETKPAALTDQATEDRSPLNGAEVSKVCD